MSFVYYFFSLFLYLISLPFLLFLLLKPKYKKSIPARFFLYKNPPFFEKRYYFHACSLGETKALKPIINELDKVNLSVITNTGYEEARKYKNADVRFLPYEIFLPFWFKECKTLVVMEAELWYMLFFIGKKRCEKTILLNARISDKSYSRYKKFKWFYRQIFKNVDLVLAQSEKDKKRLQELGAKNVIVIGNIKTFFKPEITKVYEKSKPLIVLASTHAGEEEKILPQIDLTKYQVAIVPRHPERFEEVAKLAEKFGEIERLTDIKSNKLTKDIVIVDKMGELVNFYNIADAVILGGSFVDNVGGHNPIEPAYFNLPIISGKHYFNQYALYKEIKGIEVCETHEISQKLNSLKPTEIKNKIDIKKVIEYIK